MNKIKGIHFYVNVLNMMSIIKEEQEKDEDLKRTIHRLQTYFCGFSKLLSIFGATLEKYTGARGHVVFEVDEDDIKDEITKVFKTIVACFIYNNEIFNTISKYSQYNYTDFKVHAGMDYGSFAWYEIDEFKETEEQTTIGAVANNSAKIQTYAGKNMIYIMDRLYKKLPLDIKERFNELTEEEMEELSGKIKDSKIYKVEYSEIFDVDTMEEIREELKTVETRVNDEANKLKIGEISFSGATKRINFSKVSINNNKKFDGGVLCADIRGFTKLFHKTDGNLDDLSDVIKEIYSIMGETTEEDDGVKVQYQGDRIVAIFHDFQDSTDYRIRMLRCAFNINEKIQELAQRFDIQEKLKQNNISVGIGCAIGNIIATRLGSNGNKDNIILSYSSTTADKCEDRYADSNEVVICKTLHDEIVAEVANSSSNEYEVLKEAFVAIATTGYYTSSLLLTEFVEKVREKEQAKASQKAKELFKAGFIKNSEGESVNVQTRPWGTRYE
ncbi:adenylate/guanylate cyclase domain-containing protein [Alkaliphilus peptidifermentans]|uniref:Adenylate and Guanylate cyclase catalytic domain-containing protein n=1 Tax=Alkaliphilus peptidifermentans DSM 18978 TaxID=1120976 RepID=A0A1G5JH58_9FIRM|nr:adenylate/guanylate cyclase domain-containing protein [Alkaliphilus peptidifermentans]SCY87617.1 Adenylate and Guanylate cyclase catalytic domain-containing protein [Alkaliphilus peptidifermentans DSM 18978]